MTQYNSLNVKLSNSQLNRFKSVIKNETETENENLKCSFEIIIEYDW